jgi:hypothetical protein
VVGLPDDAFSEPTLSEGYAPFNVYVMGDFVVIAYALRNATSGMNSKSG